MIGGASMRQPFNFSSFRRTKRGANRIRRGAKVRRPFTTQLNATPQPEERHATTRGAKQPRGCIAGTSMHGDASHIPPRALDAKARRCQDTPRIKRAKSQQKDQSPRGCIAGTSTNGDASQIPPKTPRGCIADTSTNGDASQIPPRELDAQAMSAKHAANNARESH